MTRIFLNTCLIFIAITCVNAEEKKADILQHMEEAKGSGAETTKNPKNFEKISTGNSSWATGENTNLPNLDGTKNKNSSVASESFKKPELNVLPETPVPTLMDPKEEIILRMIESDHDISDKTRSILVKTLSQYKMEALQKLYDSGFRAVVKEDHEDFPSSKFGPASQYYTKPKIYMRKDYLEGTLWTKTRTVAKNLASWALREVPWGGPRETIMHEVGHAWDFNVQGGEQTDPRLKELYKNHLAAVEEDSKNRWSYYATNPPLAKEYLAEGYRMYGQSEKSNRILREKDPEFYKWLKPRADALYDF